MKDEINTLRDKVTDLQCRSMKQNLIFHGIANESRFENTEEKLRNFLYYELGIEDHIEFGNVHRFGRHERGKDRPIVARFLYQSDLLYVKQNAYKLRGSCYSVREQFPQAVEDRRKILYPIMKRHKEAGDTVKLVRDRLYINNRPYVEPRLSDSGAYHNASLVDSPSERRHRLSDAYSDITDVDTPLDDQHDTYSSVARRGSRFRSLAG
ncbi:hypothetical protein FSP39_020206 [Pinctada imbricata]|uniref:Uncharacterized protein n=1 Tax=Pinctada imbricata TaxID=66713 RepID=A0AA88YSN7_PINIB|nr:hypothetical protein FSP39_020206 [Pinctada imbricata]